MRKLASFFLPILFLSSCSLLGPDYHKPTVDKPVTWEPHGEAIHYSHDNVTQLAWWKNFHDPKLNQLMDEALANNTDLQSSVGNLLQAQAALKSVKMGWVPSLYAGGGGVAGIITDSSLTLPNQTLNLLDNPQGYHGYDVGFLPQYTINVFAQMKQTEISSLSLEAQRQAANAVRIGVISQVAASYFSLLGLKEQLGLQKKILAESEQLRQYTETQYNQGSISSVSLADLEQHIATIKSQVPVTENNIVEVSNALRVLTNHNPGKIDTYKTFDNIDQRGIIPVNLPSEVLENRPDVAMAEYQLKINNANIGLVKSAFFPTINLTGAAPSLVSFDIETLFKGTVWATQMEAGMPLLNLSLYADIDRAKGGYYSAYYNYLGTVRRAFEQVDDGLSQHAALDRTAKEQTIALNKARYLYKMAESQYNNGAISYANTLFSKLSINESLLIINGTKMQQMNNIVNLYQVLGGGYNADKQLTRVKKLGEEYDIK